mmetsp:Transcript_2606/g.5970  ORF Transcript_2606/g.5970 Transcript_2606/m.5970 type:complete len:121 (+) Transcript_2606:239-601(+)
MTDMIRARANARLPPEVNRIIFVKNLPFKITAEEMYDIFGKYGAIRQIRMGNTPATIGKAYVIYEDIYDAKNAVDHLSGFNVCGRYIIVLYHHPERMSKKQEMKKREDQMLAMKKKYNLK